ncbi:uncharacterized protein N0V89_003683 [Didymosphaeria variabile]|uniref:Uncharacterized protein n=1 Tax=Didymosphaeria variabile TaxID=1932322 RepID=A0A9W8XN32_9PLEO|nr:uncharacterized protein N0V89_003683 [Didymosphaeria variabile]KAJ4355663.1 hypothetical protein N0V89_003683 [Didymosphaeria variabile]
MTNTRPHVGFLALPIELRLQILENVIDDRPNAGLVYPTVSATAKSDFNRTSQGLILDLGHSSAANLKILCVCRQLRDEFTQAAFRRTVFIIRDPYHVNAKILQPLQHVHLENLRRVMLVFQAYRLSQLTSWRRPFNREDLHLDNLTIALQSTTQHTVGPMMSDDYIKQSTRDVVGLLRRLEHVKSLKFVQNAAFTRRRFQAWYNQIVGLVLKEDHYQRYDAPEAPHIEATWWDWHFDSAEKSFEFIARPAKPVVPEPDYMEMVAPLVAKLMSEMEDGLS